MGREASSIKLNKKGMIVINIARKKKGWNKTELKWCWEAEVSESTLKRFISGKSISPKNFQSLCEVVGIEEWHSLVDWENSDSTTVAQFSEEFFDASLTEKKPQSKGAIAVTGVFTSEKKLEVEMALERLRELLMKCKIVVKSPQEPESNYGCSVYGLFSPDQQLEIEVALEHLKLLLLTCTITWRGRNTSETSND
ncbi:MAG: helix-turn-helix transcriptional regulator [Okeania sp. SIO3C4]|nr:helix-turn-helix transcriptional regulator [Okeania sp. SIO3C4]